ncbi:MAG: hypothetical protein QXL69_00465 [Candidatus Bathyarchaeia archaeon]
MVETSVIIPLLILGVLVGSILRNTNVKITKRIIILGSLLAGVGNVVYAAILSFLQNRVASSVPSPFMTFQSTLNESLLLSFFIGFFIILIVFASIVLTLRIRGRTVFEE